MYSVVLLVALGTGADTPAFGHRNGCDGGGCHGASACNGGGCHGGGWSCNGGGCHGSSACNGGDCHGGRKRLFGGHGCHGSGNCHGAYTCHGCNAGYGCYGSGCHGGAACAGGCYAAPAMAPAAAPAPAPAPAPKPGPAPAPAPKPDKEVNLSAPATIIVSLPAEAKLAVDDHVTTSTSATRVLVSPNLNPGKDYHYELKAELVRDGQKLTSVKQVAVRAGQETRVRIEFPTTSVAAK